MRPQCYECEHYDKPEALSPDGTCELVMDKIKTGCQCSVNAYLIKFGCPVGTFPAVLPTRRREIPKRGEQLARAHQKMLEKGDVPGFMR